MTNASEKLKKDVKIEDALIDDLVQRHDRKKIKRMPLHRARKLNVSIELDQDYHYYIANNTDDNLEKFLAAGYGFVENDAHKKEKADHKDVSYSSQFGKYINYNVGGGIKGYLMRIKKKHWKEERGQMDDENEKIEKQIGLDKLPAWAQRGKIRINSSDKNEE